MKRHCTTYAPTYENTDITLHNLGTIIADIIAKGGIVTKITMDKDYVISYVIDLER